MPSRRVKRARGRAAKPAKRKAPSRKTPSKKTRARKSAPRSRTVTRKPARRAAPARRPAEARPAPPPRVPNSIGLVSHHTDYTSHDMAGVKRFYTELLGFSQFIHDPSMDYLYVSTSPTSSLGFMPPMPGPPEQWRPPREPALYFMVEDVDRAHRELAAQGVAFDQEPTDMPWGHRLAVLRDPEGRRVCLAHELKR